MMHDTFGETDSTTGEWKPITSPSVTYGTNGFFLKFENASSFGEDSSGNDNDFTSNGSPTQNVDTPSNILATMNPLIPYNASSSNKWYFFKWKYISRIVQQQIQDRLYFWYISVFQKENGMQK